MEFEGVGFEYFETELEEFEVRKIGRFERAFKVGLPLQKPGQKVGIQLKLSTQSNPNTNRKVNTNKKPLNRLVLN